MPRHRKDGAVSIPFLREASVDYGVSEQVSPSIRRVMAKNPGPFTYLGTGTYIVGRGEVAVIDPGPDLAEHLDALRAALADDRVTDIVVTHTHMDHSPLAHPLARATGATVWGLPAPGVDTGFDEADEGLFRPHRQVEEGTRIAGPGWTLEAMLTPGHASNHVAYALIEENALFPGDHVMGWSTTVISPPDGDMAAYFGSLAKVRARGFDVLWPTHGPPIREVTPFLDAYRDHRLAREAQVLQVLEAGPSRIMPMVEALYAAVDRRLHPAAAHSLWAHLIKLVREGRVACAGEPGLDGEYRLDQSAPGSFDI